MNCRLPSAVICGFTKCATSSLHDWLTHHPRIFGGMRKELEYFYDRESYFFNEASNFAAHGWAGYSALFPEREGGLYVDATPAYAYHRQALTQITLMPSKPLCIFVVRDPVEQIISTFHYFSNNKLYIDRGTTLETFLGEVLSGENSAKYKIDHLRYALEYAQFSRHLGLWADAIGSERLHVVSMTSLLSSPLAVVGGIVTRLGLDVVCYEGYDFPPANQTYYVRSRIAQQANVMLRRLLPPGRVYRTLRSCYRKINTFRERPSLSDRGQELCRELRATLSQEYEAQARFS